MQLCPRYTLNWIMACRLFCAKLLPEPNWLIYVINVNWPLRNKLQWNFNRNTKLFIHGNTFKMSSVKWLPFCNWGWGWGWGVCVCVCVGGGGGGGGLGGGGGGGGWWWWWMSWYVYIPELQRIFFQCVLFNTDSFPNASFAIGNKKTCWR